MNMEPDKDCLANSPDRKIAEEIVEANIKIISASYDKMIAYTNLIIIAGYASFFGLWQITKDKLGNSQSIWAALLIAISISVFVLFEVTKTFFNSRCLLKHNKIITNPKIASSAEALKSAFDQHNQTINRQVVSWGYWWTISWIITVITGIAAIGFLLWSFIQYLFWQV